LNASLSIPTAGGPTPGPKQVAVGSATAEASARMLSFATTRALAKIGPRWKPTVNEATLANRRSAHTPVQPVGEAGNGDAQQRIEQHEAEACEQDHRGVAEGEFLFDRLDQGG
jgi:hypothetical protein